eukprot:COSAG01_NODE_7487_length_3189_cov_201.714239_2_plen_68_part_00
MHGSPIQRQNRSSGSMIDQEIDSQARDSKNAPESAGQAAGRWQAAMRIRAFKDRFPAFKARFDSLWM